MVYKKYIKKNGKVYGPYVYHSRRVDGKVVSEYHGQDKSDYKKYFLFIFGFLFFALLIFFFYNFNQTSITGNVVLSSDVNSVTENSVEKLGISLKKGELIPASSIVVIEDSGQEYEYFLSDLISEDLVEGNYYADGKSLSGDGEGYGIKGTRLSYPEIYFTLISTPVNSDEEINEQPEIESSENNEVNVEEDPEEEILEEFQNETIEGEIVEETEEVVENIESEPEVAEEINEEETEEVPEVIEVEESEFSESDEQSADEEQIEQEVVEEIEQPSEETSAPITGGVISNLFKTVSNFFLSFLSPTGGVISDTTEINGKVSANNPFIYSLSSSEKVELLSGSVKTNLENLADDIITISIQENNLIIETDYSKLEEGFGKDYLGDEEKIFYLNIPENLTGQDFSMRILYDDEDLIFVKQEPEVINESINSNVESLSEEEKLFIEEKLGNISIETTKTELFKGRYIVEYSLGDYKIEYSYDSGLSEEVLKQQMETDKIKWLRDIISGLSWEESIAVPVNLSSS